MFDEEFKKEICEKFRCKLKENFRDAKITTSIGFHKHMAEILEFTIDCNIGRYDGFISLRSFIDMRNNPLIIDSIKNAKEFFNSNGKEVILNQISFAERKWNIRENKTLEAIEFFSRIGIEKK